MKKYDTYKDSGIEWIGEIPSHWEVKRLKYVAEIILGKMLTKENKGDMYLKPYLRAANIGWLNVDISDIKEMWFTQDELKKLRLMNNDLLVSEGGEVGRTCIWKNELNECYIQNSVHKVTMNEDCSPSYFLNQFYIFGQKGAFDLIVNRISIAHLTVEKLREVEFIVPPLQEQTAIAAYLDRKTAEIDELIADKKRLLELYEEEKTAIINQAVTKGINPNAPMKDSGIEWLGEIPEHWEVKRFDYLFRFSRGLSITKADLKDSGIPCVSYGEIHSKYGFEVDPTHHSLRCVDEQYLISNEKSLLEFGDFVFADTSEDIEGSGNFTYLNSNVPTFAGYHTIIGKPLIDFERRYVAYFFNTLSFRNQIRSKVTGTKVYSITQAILKFTNILFPPISEQGEIVEFIDKECARIDAKKAKTEKLIELLTEYRTALISEVVTGKIKVID